jgi:predicted phage terminase large subunit-like protein
LARRIPRWCRDDLRAHPELGLSLAPGQRAAFDWRVSNGQGGMYAAGIAGVWSGSAIDFLVIDDPIKGREQADSPMYRDKVWDWWESTASARLSEGAPVVLITTRWHHDDLAGRLIRDDPQGWRVVHIPAQADPEVVDPDPLGRRPGEFMLSARGRTPESWEKRKATAGGQWQPLYQGAPQAPGGEFFRVDKLRYWREPVRDEWSIVCGQRVWRLDVDCWIFATVDPAGTATKAGNDYTVVGVWAVPLDGSLVLLDLARARVPGHRHMHLARPLIERWKVQRVFVEPTLKSTQLVREAAAAGWPVEDVIADKSKEVRAQPLAQRVDDGMVWLPAGHPLLGEVVKELREFPVGAHDDIVDVCAYAAAVNYRRYAPPLPAPARRPVAVGEVVADRATSVPPGFDPARAQF